MTLKEIGETLKQERLRKSISTDELMRRTKISRRNLEALEAGDLSGLPHMVYIKGFVRTYSRVVGLDGEELAARVVEVCGDDECLASRNLDPEAPQTVITGATGGAPKSRRNLVLLLSVLVFLVGAGWFGYTVIQKGGLPFDSTPSVSSPAQDNAAESTPEAATDGQTAESDAAPVAQDPVPAPAPEVSETETTQPPVATETDEPQKAETVEEATPQAEQQQSSAQDAPKETLEQARKEAVLPQGHNLLIVADEACWVESKADDEDMRDFYLHEGDKIRLRFRDHLRVRLGNAGGVDLTYDGKEFPLQAEKGQVKTLNFPVSATE